MSNRVHVHRDGNRIRVELDITVPDGQSMLGSEELILDQLNDAGRLATAECLEGFDSDGSPIEVGGIKFTSKGRVSKGYQTPYGEVSVARHVYQTSEGGRTYCPLDQSARVICSSTPRFAQMCSLKYGTTNASEAQRDLAKNHGRKVSRCFLQDIAQAVAEVAQSKEERWSYTQPPLDGEVSHAALSIDGTCLLFCQEGWRNAMIGTIALYDVQGERLYTSYVASAPEYGKAAFLKKMEREIAVHKRRYPKLRWVGIADGAKDYWPWLEQFVEDSVLDFYHAASYLESAAEGIHRTDQKRKAWFEESRARLKEEPGAANELLGEIQQALEKPRMSQRARDNLQKAATYFENNLARMDYNYYRRNCLPIGSGVTEAACKTIVRQRMCGSGMKWRHQGASTVLTLRSLILSDGRWDQFWSKISSFGI